MTRLSKSEKLRLLEEKKRKNEEEIKRLKNDLKKEERKLRAHRLILLGEVMESKGPCRVNAFSDDEFDAILARLKAYADQYAYALRKKVYQTDTEIAESDPDSMLPTEENSYFDPL